MGKIVTTKINRWDGGVQNDPRARVSNGCRVVTNFDALTNPYRLTPYRSSEDGASNGAADLQRRWCVALGASSTYKLFALARQDAADKVRIMVKDITTGASTDLDDNGWTETANNTATANSTVDYDMFTWYPKLNMIFGFHGNRYIFEYDPDGGTAFNETDADLGASSDVTCDGFVHPYDDNLYVFYVTSTLVPTIARNNNGTWTTALKTLPIGYKITSACPYGAKIALALSPNSGVGSSVIIIYDQTNDTIDEVMDGGDGTVRVLEELEGNLIGLVITSGLSLASATRFSDRVSFRVFSNFGMQELALIQGTTSSQLPIFKQRINNRIHFLMNVVLNGKRREGVWSFGKNKLGQWALFHERTPDNDTLTENSGLGALRGFYYIGDFLFQAFVNGSSAHEVSKTDDTATYSHTSYWESLINPNMPEEDLHKDKQLKSVVVRYVALPSAGQVVLKQRTDSTTAWSSVTAAFTDTTDNSIYQEMVANGATQFTKGRELEFELESTGGAEIMELAYTYEVLESNA